MEDTQLHINFVTEEPHHHHHSHSDSALDRGHTGHTHAAGRGGQQEQLEESRRQSQEGTSYYHHHRHYQDYGTVSLGTLDSPAPSHGAPEPGPEAPAAPSQGQVQREFYDRYSGVLNRKYQTRNKSNLARMLMVVLLLGVIVVISLIALNSMSAPADTGLEKATRETVPAVVRPDDLG